jgi:hypothetical protein
MGWYDRKVCRVRDLSCGDTRIYLELEVRRIDCSRCGKVKREQLDFLADNAHYTKRFAYYVGRRCRSATIKDVAAELKLDWHTVKTLDQQYMEAQLKRAGTPGPQVSSCPSFATVRPTPPCSRPPHCGSILLWTADLAISVFLSAHQEHRICRCWNTLTSLCLLSREQKSSVNMSATDIVYMHRRWASIQCLELSVLILMKKTTSYSHKPCSRL